jgi:tetratricopeptide (TPR) repeat protein
VRHLFLLLAILLLFSAHAETENHPLAEQAQQYFDNGQYEQAASTYTQLITQLPDTKEGYFNRGLCYYKLKQYTNAIPDFEKCLQLDSTTSDALLMLSLCYEHTGQLKQAIAGYEKLKETDTNSTLLNSRIKSYRLSVLVSKNWYYMVAMMLVVILLMAVVAKSYSYRKG